MKIVAISYRSAGNESVGDMWRETKIFEPETPVIEIFKWASGDFEVKNYKGHLEITIANE